MLAYIYAVITLVLIALAVIGVPNGRKALRYYLTVTTVYLNLRFDVDIININNDAHVEELIVHKLLSISAQSVAATWHLAPELTWPKLKSLKLTFPPIHHPV